MPGKCGSYGIVRYSWFTKPSLIASVDPAARIGPPPSPHTHPTSTTSRTLPTPTFTVPTPSISDGCAHRWHARLPHGLRAQGAPRAWAYLWDSTWTRDRCPAVTIWLGLRGARGLRHKRYSTDNTALCSTDYEMLGSSKDVIGGANKVGYVLCGRSVGGCRNSDTKTW